MRADTHPGLEPVYSGEETSGWILGWDLTRAPRGSATPDDDAAERWILSLVETLALPRDSCTWMGWDPFELRLPAPWEADGEGPTAERWSEARLFHPRFEIRLQRAPGLVRLRLLTEEEPVGVTAARLAEEHMAHSRVIPCPEPFRTLPGRILLVGRRLPLDGLVPEGTLGEIQYPRLLRYLGPNGTPAIDDRSGRIPVQVVRYFDRVYRLRAIRYKAWEA